VKSTSPHILNLDWHLMGRGSLFAGRSMCTRGKDPRYPLHSSRSISGHCWRSFTLLTEIGHYNILIANWRTLLRRRRWLQLCSVSQSAPACIQLNHVHTALSLEFRLYSTHFKCLICNCVPAVKSGEKERLPGVSWRRAFNSSFEVWPLLLLSTSETPESAGLGGREPGTREYI
jgi:hypothetical protein